MVVCSVHGACLCIEVLTAKVATKKLLLLDSAGLKWKLNRNA